MGTVKPKLQGYIREDLYIQFESERGALGLSQSQALEKILLERYGEDSDVSSPPNRESLYWITKSLEDLLERVKKLEITGNLDSDSLSNLPSNLESDSPSNLESDSPSNLDSNLPSNLESDSLSNLDSNLPSNLDSNLPSNLESDSPSNLPSNLESNLDSNLPSNLESNLDSNLPSNLESDSPSNLDSNLPSNLESDSPSNLPVKAILAKGLGQRALAKRLGCTYQGLGNAIILGDGDIESWSQRQDPDGLAWEMKNKKFYPRSL